MHLNSNRSLPRSLALKMIEKHARVRHRAQAASPWRAEFVVRQPPPLLLACADGRPAPAAVRVQVLPVGGVLQGDDVRLVAGFERPFLLVALVASVLRDDA